MTWHLVVQPMRGGNRWFLIAVPEHGPGSFVGSFATEEAAQSEATRLDEIQELEATFAWVQESS